MSTLSTCAICLDDIKDKKILNCNHVFCVYCITKYEHNGGRLCPCCRKPFSTIYTMSIDDQLLLLKLKFDRFDEHDYSYEVYYSAGDTRTECTRTIVMNTSRGELTSKINI